MKQKSITILAIETSCDETGVAIVEGSGGLRAPRVKILSSVVASQIKIHRRWGGVVPNLAKREHIKNLPVVFNKACEAARRSDLRGRGIDAIAVTAGPGLEPALWTGINFAKDLAQRWQVPVVAANHMEGHLAAVLLNPREKEIRFPALALLVSGGHTELILISDWLKYKKIGETEDDAVGEAFDKVARMLGLTYPGGPELERLAKTGNPAAFHFPRPMIHTKDFNFSFSGLKTAVLYTLRELKEKKVRFSKKDIASSFEEAAVEALVSKTIRAVQKFDARSLILGGGVAANEHLRRRIRSEIKKNKITASLHLPHRKLTTDNAAIIGAAAYLHAEKKDFTSWKQLQARATLDL